MSVATEPMKDAILAVERLGIAPLKRNAAARPDTYSGDAWGTWLSRRAEIERKVTADLEKRGAKVGSDSQGRAVFRMAGLTATSTQGLLAALSNWRSRARIDLAKRAGR